MKEKITKFDLDAAFKALDEIEIPKVGGVKSNRLNLQESVKKVDRFETLLEDYYDIQSQNGLMDAQEDRNADVAQAKLDRIEKIVDLDAKTPEDILPSYVGKTIIQCPQCMTLFYKKPEDIVVSEEDEQTVNVGEVCQHCGSDSGYTVIGKVAEETPAAQEQDIPVEDNAEDLNMEEEPTEENTEEETNEENADADLDLDLDIDLGEEEEDEKKESLNRSKFLKNIEKDKMNTKFHSDYLTLNEDVDESLKESVDRYDELRKQYGGRLVSEVIKDAKHDMKTFSDSNESFEYFIGSSMSAFDIDFDKHWHMFLPDHISEEDKEYKDMRRGWFDNEGIDDPLLNTNESLKEAKSKKFPDPDKNSLVDTYKDVKIYDCTCGKYVAKINGKKVKKDSIKELKKCIDGECNESLKESYDELDNYQEIVDSWYLPIEDKPEIRFIKDTEDPYDSFIDVVDLRIQAFVRGSLLQVLSDVLYDLEQEDLEKIFSNESILQKLCNKLTDMSEKYSFTYENVGNIVKEFINKSKSLKEAIEDKELYILKGKNKDGYGRWILFGDSGNPIIDTTFRRKIGNYVIFKTKEDAQKFLDNMAKTQPKIIEYNFKPVTYNISDYLRKHDNLESINTKYGKCFGLPSSSIVSNSNRAIEKDELKDESLKESQSQEIGSAYQRLSKKYGIDFEDLVYGPDGFMNNNYPNGFPDFAGDVYYSRKYWDELVDWAKQARGIDLSESLKEDSNSNGKSSVRKALNSYLDSLSENCDKKLKECDISEAVNSVSDEEFDAMLDNPIYYESLNENNAEDDYEIEADNYDDYSDDEEESSPKRKRSKSNKEKTTSVAQEIYDCIIIGFDKGDTYRPVIGGLENETEDIGFDRDYNLIIWGSSPDLPLFKKVQKIADLFDVGTKGPIKDKNVSDEERPYYMKLYLGEYGFREQPYSKVMGNIDKETLYNIIRGKDEKSEEESLVKENIRSDLARFKANLKESTYSDEYEYEYDDLSRVEEMIDEYNIPDGEYSIDMFDEHVLIVNNEQLANDYIDYELWDDNEYICTAPTGVSIYNTGDQNFIDKRYFVSYDGITNYEEALNKFRNDLIEMYERTGTDYYLDDEYINPNNKFDNLEEIQEESFNRHVTNYLKEVYSNVKNFNATNCEMSNKSLIIEGKIKFNSGKEKSVRFDFTRNGDKLYGKNNLINESNAFKLNYTIHNNKLITSGLKYSYKINGNLVEGYTKKHIRKK